MKYDARLEVLRAPAAKIAADLGHELAIEANIAYDLMKAMGRAVWAFENAPTVKGKLNDNGHYSRAHSLVESPYLAQDALHVDLSNAAGELIGYHKLGSEYYESAQ